MIEKSRNFAEINFTNITRKIGSVLYCINTIDMENKKISIVRYNL